MKIKRSKEKIEIWKTKKGIEIKEIHNEATDIEIN